MYQQQTPQPRDEGGYRQNHEYEAGYSANQQENDQLADAIARRLQAGVPGQQSFTGFGTRPRSNTATAGQRLALAIVSVCILLPISIVLLAVLGPAGFVGLGIACATIFAINLVFNLHLG